MKFKGTKLSKRTVALFAAAILLLGTGGFMGISALPQYIGDDYYKDIELDKIDVTLWENGEDVSDGTLLLDLKGVANPGMTYNENISVKNSSTTADEFVRLVVRKYWTDTDGNKDTTLDPNWIELDLASDSWKLVERTDEMSYYYCTNQLSPGDESQVFKAVRINRAIADEVTKESKSVDGGTVWTYKYKYDGYVFNVEAEAQAVQTHNANDAIKSIWGVDNVTASGNSLSVK